MNQVWPPSNTDVACKEGRGRDGKGREEVIKFTPPSAAFRGEGGGRDR